MNILTDNSPHYLTFQHNDFEKIVRLAASTETNDWQRDRPFRHELLPTDLADEILSMVPKAEELKLIKGRASLFISQPGLYYRAHKDGMNLRFGVNYPIVIRDSGCVTRWYDDSVSEFYETDLLNGRSRELAGFNPWNHTPTGKLCMKDDAVVLFNTERYHDWTNKKSTNIRVILALRSSDPKITYEIAREILLNE